MTPDTHLVCPAFDDYIANPEAMTRMHRSLMILEEDYGILGIRDVYTKSCNNIHIDGEPTFLSLNDTGYPEFKEIMRIAPTAASYAGEAHIISTSTAQQVKSHLSQMMNDDTQGDRAWINQIQTRDGIILMADIFDLEFVSAAARKGELSLYVRFLPYPFGSEHNKISGFSRTNHILTALFAPWVSHTIQHQGWTLTL